LSSTLAGPTDVGAVVAVVVDADDVVVLGVGVGAGIGAGFGAGFGAGAGETGTEVERFSAPR
jgi:hypothetical protein